MLAETSVCKRKRCDSELDRPRTFIKCLTLKHTVEISRDKRHIVGAILLSIILSALRQTRTPIP